MPNSGADNSYLCFDLGGTKVAAARITLPHAFCDAYKTAAPKVEALGEISTEAAKGGTHVLDRLTSFAAELLAKLEAENLPVRGIGIAAAGILDPETGEILSATDLIPDWAGQNLYRAFRAITTLPVRLTPDVGAHGLGEAIFGAGVGFDRLLSVGVGTGIGGALIEAQQIAVGAHQLAGQLGHACHPLAQGLTCSCGATCGHIEAVASGSGLGALYQRFADSPEPVATQTEAASPQSTASTPPVPPHLTGKKIAELAAQGDEIAQQVIRESALALGEYLGGVANILDPQAIVLSGSVTQSGAPWFAALAAGFAASALPPARNIPLLPAQLGWAAPLVGAASECHRYWQRHPAPSASSSEHIAASDTASPKAGATAAIPQFVKTPAIPTARPAIHPLIQSLRGTLIVSCQAYPGEPLCHSETMAQMALAAEAGGASAIRCQGLADIAAIKGQVKLPVIGLWKDGAEGVYITPTLRHARSCLYAGADIVALDATRRPRPDGLTYAQTVAALHQEGALVMADCGSFADAQQAVEAGSDIISTTLAGYTGERPQTAGPDLELLREIVAAFPDTPIICEGRIHTPEQLAKVMESGAWAAVVGTAITHPTTITSWFRERLKP